MLLLFLLSHLASTALSKPITLKLESLPSHTSLGDIRSKAQSPQVCSKGERTLVVDAERRTQTLQWNIGAIDAISTPIQCETTLSTEYNPQWQYAVTKINWHAYAKFPQGSGATAGLSYGFGQGSTNLPATLNWLITGPLDSIWDQKSPIPLLSQKWTPCGTVSPLTLQWSVKIAQNTKSLASPFQSSGQLGRATSAGGNLTLGVTTEFRECPGASVQSVVTLAQPTPI
ncbi:hypothetical protein FKW77_007645 [Venturia effusa]|uniref:Uncharacterized protein n=1 Tax=Venturia effusa TaxID=50376 RepID=A0A517LE53_9PEZI|nr:hypothetical protein FKW77_007645 [Venturia effusa]